MVDTVMIYLLMHTPDFNNTHGDAIVPIKIRGLSGS